MSVLDLYIVAGLISRTTMFLQIDNICTLVFKMLQLEAEKEESGCWMQNTLH